MLTLPCDAASVAPVAGVVDLAESAKKVLVADDKAPSRELVRLLLERSGHVVWEASDGAEAVRTAREIFPDLILLDLQMPELDGAEVLEALRKDRRFDATPIVALTASAMPQDRERCAGFTAFITKPISVELLRAQLGRLLAPLEGSA
jgi:two-component system cell cycle response regulator DivK